MQSFLPLGPQLDTGRLGRHVLWPGQHPAAEPPSQHNQTFSGLSLLLGAALRASLFSPCSGRAVGVTAHMSQHDLGVSRQACPLTFPTLRMHAGSAKRRWGDPMLPPCLCKCYHMVHSLTLPTTVILCCSASLSQPITGAVFDCGPDKQELYDLSPGLAVPSPGLILKPNCSPSQPFLLSLHPLPPFAVAGEGCFLAGNE